MDKFIKIEVERLPETGPYTLDSDITNPHPDRRTKQWDCQPVFPRGRYYIRSERHHDKSDASGVEWYGVDIRKANDFGRVTVLARPREGGGWVLTIPADENTKVRIALMISGNAFTPDLSAEAFVRWLNSDGIEYSTHVLAKLLDEGAVSREQILRAVERVHQKWDSE